MPTLTIRNLPAELLEKLREAKETRGQSINQIVLRTLMAAFAVDPCKRDLSKYTTWTQQDQDELMVALSEQRKVDDDLWK